MQLHKQKANSASVAIGPDIYSIGSMTIDNQLAIVHLHRFQIEFLCITMPLSSLASSFHRFSFFVERISGCSSLDPLRQCLDMMSLNPSDIYLHFSIEMSLFSTRHHRLVAMYRNNVLYRQSVSHFSAHDRYKFHTKSAQNGHSSHHHHYPLDILLFSLLASLLYLVRNIEPPTTTSAHPLQLLEYLVPYLWPFTPPRRTRDTARTSPANAPGGSFAL